MLNLSQRMSVFMAVLGFVILSPAPLLAAKAPVHTSSFSKFGAGGYDPVAYFTLNKATKGQEDLSVEWSGVKWRFSSQENLDKFLAAPDSYMPQYGGYDPLGVAEGKLSGGKPKIWTVVDNKLYLHKSRNSRDYWRVERRDWVSQANSQWPQVLQDGGALSLPDFEWPSFKLPWFGKGD